MQDSTEPSGNRRRIADRYEVISPLGHGGMASVYRVTDVANGREVGLKQLALSEHGEQRAGVAALFEREYHTLAQLSHPRVIEVYDYGVDAQTGPYYTMELLDGGDLRDRSPLPWRDACTLLFDVCSSLALLHSRRLLHRDVSPRNIRCTRDGQAKLIDFGAMAPMGAGGGQIVGTPAFTSPETLQRSALDARADLFSLGATLYYALTKKTAYAARSFAEVLKAWSVTPQPPSARVEGIPPALDDLVMSLLSLEPALRPHSAFEVMQRLAAIAGLPSSEPDGVSRAYLSTPSLVGREDALGSLRAKLKRALAGRGSGVLVRAAAGLGRSRILDACSLEAKTLGGIVLRATASGTKDDFAVALALTQHLREALPSDSLDRRFPELFEHVEGARGEDSSDESARRRPQLKSVAELKSDPERLQQSICRFILTVSATHPLLVAVDDVQRIDEPSAAVLARLVDKARRASLLVALTVESESRETTLALDVLTRRCAPLALSPLSREQTRALLGSVFGDVANLDMVADEIHRIAGGNPRQSMDLAQHLVDNRAIEYGAGIWTLPSSLSTADLPSSAEEAIRVRLGALTPLARSLCEAQALAFDGVFTHADYHALRPDVGSSAIDGAISELLAQQVLASDGQSYALANRVWSKALEDGLGSAHRERHHRALSKLYQSKSDLAVIHHLFAGGLDEQGLGALSARHQQYAENFDIKLVLEMNAANMGPSYERAIQTALALGRPARVAHELRRWLVSLSVVIDPGYYFRAAPIWLEQLKRDSGLTFWEQDSQTVDAGERLTKALTRANESHLALKESERVYRFDEAIRFLAQFVACSLAVGARIMDTELLSRLPPLLEPFAPLSPVVHAIWQNATAACEANRDCRYIRARARWMEVHEKLGRITGAELQHVGVIRNAVAYGIGVTEAVIGLASATTWAAHLDHDPLQKLSGMYLRKIVCLEQGDWSGADRLRRQAEVHALQARAPQMFTTLLASELSAHALARDLAGVKDVMERIEALASRHPGWVPHLHLAEARFQLIRGDFAAAKSGFDQCIRSTAFEASGESRAMSAWVAAQAGRAEALLGLGSFEQARADAASALVICEQRQVDVQAYDVARVLALAEARLGNFESAITRLETLIQEQKALGVTGLKLGVSYEARAQIAIWGDDPSAFERYARLTAREYKRGARSPLGARYERLLNEARRRNFQPIADAPEVEATTIVRGDRTATYDVSTAVSRAMAGAERIEERASRALQLVCEVRSASCGHLYLLHPEGVALCASHGIAAPPEDLVALVRAHLAREQRQTDTQTMVLTENVTDDVSVQSSTVHVGGTSYELLLIAAGAQDVGKVAGVIAVEASERSARNVRERELLATIAAHLIQASERAGVPLGYA